ncbi:MAG: hypothetical protein HQM14_19220 [SAR324 cluster bacterium]|nr:hypothetical protein [SAR324 cluster bacterium]
MGIDHIVEKQRINQDIQKMMVDRFYERMDRIRKEERAKIKETEVVRQNEITEKKRIDAEERHHQVREADEAAADVVRERRRLANQKIRINRNI